jgi:hypothetical protein
VLNGIRSHVSGAQQLVEALAAPGWQEGCALLPQGLRPGPVAGPGDAPTLSLNSQGSPASLRWHDKRGAQITLNYADYQAAGGGAYPATITEAVAGKTRLEVHLTSFAAHAGFSDSDFAVPSMPSPRHVAAGGGGAQ